MDSRQTGAGALDEEAGLEPTGGALKATAYREQKKHGKSTEQLMKKEDEKLHVKSTLSMKSF